MDHERWDLLARRLEGMGTRRAVIRAITAVLAAFAPAGLRPRHAHAAPPPIPPASQDPWPACSAERPHYCVAAFSVDGVDQLAAETPEYAPNVRGTRGSPGAGAADRLEWSPYRASTYVLQEADLDKAFVLRIRTGRLEPVLSLVTAAGVQMRVTGDAASGWEVEVEGRPGLVPSWEGPEPSEQATITFVWFQGMSPSRDAPEASQWRFEGYMAVSGVRAFSAPRWRGDGWDVFLESPHLMPDGSVTHGRYRAWMTAGTLELLRLSTPQAVSGGLAVTRIDAGVSSAVDVEISQQDGGVLIDIPDLTFSSPTIAIRRRGKQGCAKPCGKRRKCKKGRCVKKRGKKR